MEVILLYKYRDGTDNKEEERCCEYWIPNFEKSINGYYSSGPFYSLTAEEWYDFSTYWEMREIVEIIPIKR